MVAQIQYLKKKKNQVVGLEKSIVSKKPFLTLRLIKS